MKHRLSILVILFMTMAFPQSLKLKAQTVVDICDGGTLTAQTGTITDVSGDGDYSDNMDCQILIQPEGAAYVMLSFSEFNTEECCDHVEVYDGDNTGATLLGSFSGSDMPATIYSTGGRMLLRFVTDGSVTYGGWTATYRGIGGGDTASICDGGTLTAQTGTITDGSGDGNYSDNMDCQILIQPEGATYVMLSFSEFNTEECCDHVEVYDGDNTGATLLGSFSGSDMPATIYSTGGSMLLRFVTDGSVTYGGWTATYRAMDALPTYQVGAYSNDGNMGTVTGGGEYTYGTTATLTATANEGYTFMHWSDGNTDNPRYITVYQTAAYTAEFTGPITISVLPNDGNMGTVTGGGEYTYGTTATLTATANEGYIFMYWDDGYTFTSRDIVVTEDATYTAIFRQPDPQVPASVPSNGLMAYYGFDGNANDLSGNGNHGILGGANGGPSASTDRFGNETGCYEFGGYNSKNWIDVANSNSLHLDTSFSISFWIQECTRGGTDGYGRYSTDGYHVAVLAKAGDGHSCPPGLWVHTSRDGNHTSRLWTDIKNTISNFNINFNTETSTAYRDCYQPCEWLHVVMVVDGHACRIYYNGVEEFDTTFSQMADFSTANNSDMHIGIEGGHYWNPNNGKLDDLGIWNRPLTAEEIATLYGNFQQPEIGCNMVTTLSVVSVTTTDVNLEWTNSCNSGETTARIVVDGTTVATGVQGNSYTVTNLTPSTEYTISVYTECQSGSESEPVTVLATTACAGIVVVQANDDAMGTATGSGTYTCGTTATFTATANEGYIFMYWSDGSADNPHTVTITEDEATYTAYFHYLDPLPSSVPANGLVAYYPLDGHTLDLSGNGNHGVPGGANGGPAASTDRHGNAAGCYEFGGTSNRNWIKVNNSASLQFDTAVSFSFWVQECSATGQNGWGSSATSGYAKAIVNKGGDGIATSRGWHANINRNDEGRFFASFGNGGRGGVQDQFINDVFNACREYELCDWLHCVIVASGNRCSIYYDGRFAGDTIFEDNWNFSEANQNNMYIGIFDGERWYPHLGKIDDVAIYNRALTEEEIQVLYGSPLGTMTVIEETQTARNSLTWHDRVYTESGEYYDRQRVACDTIYKLNLTIIHAYNVDVETADGTMGTVQGAGNYDEGSTATVTATPNEGYHFTVWSDGSANNPRSFTVTEDVTLTASFAINTYTVSLSAAAGGSITGDGTYSHGSSATLMATADEGYHFVQWSDGNTDNQRTLVVTGDMTLTASFAQNNYTITATATEGGTVTGSGTYSHGSTVTLTAIAEKNHLFLGWNDSTDSNPYTFTAVADKNVSALFSSIIHDTVVDTVIVTPVCPQPDTVTLVEHDTTIVNVPVHDTTYINVHDTTIVNVPYAVHDTTYVDVPYAVHDTIYINVPYAVHDTTYINVPYPVHDTTYIDVPYAVHDTTYINVPYPVHDTTYIDVPYTVHDTTTIHDTMIAYLVHISDTALVTRYVYDSAVVTNTYFDTFYVFTHAVDTLHILDTMIINRYHFDTTIVNYYQYDTTLVNIYDTVINNVYQYDTTIINNSQYNFDTSIYNQFRFDTTLVFDTMIVNVYTYDTSVYNNYQFDTVILNTYQFDTTLVSIYDTTIYNTYQYDTTLVNIFDTVIYNVYQYDTTIINNSQYAFDTSIYNHFRYDTTLVFDTMIVNVYTYDTSIYNNYRYDTVILNYYQYDTTLVYDTTIINIYDTTINNLYQYDTVIVNNYYYDTVYVNSYTHDTVINYFYDTVNNNYYDTVIITNTYHDTVIVNNYIYDTIYLNRYIFDTIYIHDTVFVPAGTEGIGYVESFDAKIYQRGGCIVVESGDGYSDLPEVTIFDAVGRQLSNAAAGMAPAYQYQFDVPVSGTYLVKIGNHPARRIVVVR